MFCLRTFAEIQLWFNVILNSGTLTMLKRACSNKEIFATVECLYDSILLMHLFCPSFSLNRYLSNAQYPSLLSHRSCWLWSDRKLYSIRTRIQRNSDCVVSNTEWDDADTRSIHTQVEQSTKEPVGSGFSWWFHASSILVNGYGGRIYPVPPGIDRNMSKLKTGSRIRSPDFWHFLEGSDRKWRLSWGFSTEIHEIMLSESSTCLGDKPMFLFDPERCPKCSKQLFGIC
jgi:hypothetical protein